MVQLGDAAAVEEGSLLRLLDYDQREVEEAAMVVSDATPALPQTETTPMIVGKRRGWS
jgi:hypothetical protein